MTSQERWIGQVQKIVRIMLEKMGLLVHEWHYGTIKTVNVDGTLDVYIDGNVVHTPSIPSNPNVTFLVADNVFVHYINRNPNNLFVPYKRMLVI